jgi:predicted transcriptional regulator
MVRDYHDRLLKIAVRELGLSQNRIAKGAGIHQPSISNWLDDNRGLAEESVQKLVKFLEKQADDDTNYALCLAALLEHDEAALEYIDEHMGRMDNPEAARQISSIRKKKKTMADAHRRELRKVRPDLLEREEATNGESNYATWKHKM